MLDKKYIPKKIKITDEQINEYAAHLNPFPPTSNFNISFV
jgi:hypothetical protein